MDSRSPRIHLKGKIMKTQLVVSELESGRYDGHFAIAKGANGDEVYVAPAVVRSVPQIYHGATILRPLHSGAGPAMKLYRTADALPIARANAQKLQQEQPAQARSEDAKQQRRDRSRGLAEALVRSWSAAEYKQKFDAELQAALDGEAESFNPNKPKISNTNARA